MLALMRRGQRWLLWGVILIVGGVFVLYLGIGGPPAGPLPPSTVLDVDGRRYTVRDVLRVRLAQEESYREALGEDFDAQAAGSLLDQLAVSTLEGRALMATAAEQLGLRVSDDEVRRAVRRIPGALDEQGRIDADTIRFFAEREYGTETRFAETLRDHLLQEKLLRLVEASVDVSHPEALESLRRRREEVRIAYVRLDPKAPPPDLEVSEEEVARVLADEDRLRRFYSEHPERYRLPERVRVRHLLLRVEPDADPEQVEAVRRRAEALLERVRAGEDLAALAREESEDPGTREAGGDLGYLTRGQMAGPFEEVAFSREPGSPAELVRTDAGFHIVRVEERRPAETRPFEEVKAEIARELARTDRAAEHARRTAERLAEAVRQGASLEEAARAEGLTLERPDWLRRSPDGQIPGLGRAPEVLSAAFALPDDHPSSDRVFEVDGQLVLVQRLERRTPSPEELEAELADERQRLLQQRRAQAREAWLARVRQTLSEDGRLVVDLAPLQGS